MTYHSNVWRRRRYSLLDRLLLLVALLIGIGPLLIVAIGAIAALVFVAQHEPRLVEVVAGGVGLLTVLAALCFPGRVMEWQDR